MRPVILANMLRGFKKQRSTPAHNRKTTTERSLASRLIRVILGVYFVVAFSTTAVQLYAEYRHEYNGLREEIDQLAEIFTPVLARAIWDYSRVDLETAVESLYSSTPVLGVHLHSDIALTRCVSDHA